MHFIPFLLHIDHHLELGSGPVQILAIPVNGEVIVAIQMVGQEPQSAFQRHDFGAHGHHPAFVLRQAGAGVEEAAGVGLKHLQAHGNLVQILFILSGGRSAEPDAVTVIIKAQAGHDRVQIDDAQGLSGIGVQHNIVELGVIVGDTEGQTALLQHVNQGTGFFLPVQNELNLLLYIFGAAKGILFQHFPEDAVAVRGVMEIGNGLMEPAGREILQQLLKAAKGHSALIEIIGTLRQLQADGMLHKIKGAPYSAIRHLVVRMTVQCADQMKHASGIIGLVGKVFDDHGNIVHEMIHITEDMGVDLLQVISERLQELESRQRENEQLNANIEATEDRLTKFEDIGKYQQQLSSYKIDYNKKKSELASINQQIGSLEGDIDRIDGLRSELSLKNENNKNIELYKAYAERIYEVLQQDYANQEKRVRTELQDCINEIFKKIYNGGFELSIDEKYNVTTIVKDFADFNIGVETSTAQSISVIFAFIAGVIKMARSNEENDQLSTEAYPLVMDAPLSAFDKTRIQTVCDTLPNIAEQVIIFIKDTDGEIAEKYLSSKIGKSYSFNKKNEFETYFSER